MALLIALPLSLEAREFRTLELKESVELSREKLEALLGELDESGWRDVEVTLGFEHHLRSRLFSPYSYRFYIGTISTKIPEPIIRIEGNAGDVRTFARILELEQIAVMTGLPDRTEARQIYHKSQPIGQSINFIAPWAAVGYASWGSPRLTTKQTLWRSGIYFAADAFLIWAGGRNWFTDSFDPVKYGGNIAAGMALTRAIGAYQTTQLIRGHNRLVERGYTFHF